MKIIKALVGLMFICITNFADASLIVQIGPHGYYKETALSKFRIDDFNIQQLDYSVPGGWWAASQNTLRNYAGSTVHTFKNNIIDITSYDDRFVATVLDNGEFYLAGPNGYLSNTSLSKLRNADFQVKMLDYSATGGWWAAGEHQVINYGSGTSKLFDERVIDITSFNKDYAVVLLEETPKLEPEPMSNTLSPASFQNLSSPGLQQPQQVPEPTSLLILLGGIFLIAVKAKKATRGRFFYAI